MPSTAASATRQPPPSVVPAVHAHAQTYIPTLDGWRAIAILWVLFNHSQVWSFSRFSTRALSVSGYRGVQLFFALSGFLICTRLLREEASMGRISLSSFYIRRIFRLQPAATVYLTAIAVIGSVGTIQLFWPGIAGSILMIRDYWPAKTLLPGVWLTGHFWSLSVEEHFYMLLPGFLVLCRRWRLAILASMAVVFEVWRFFVLRSPTLSKWGFFAELRTDTVLGGILLGSVFAIALSHPRYLQAAQRWLKPWITLLLAAFITHLPAIRYSPLNHPASILLYPLMIVATVLHPEAIFSRFLSLPVLRFVGRISYSLYLWQQLFLNPFATAPHGSFRSHNLLCWTAAVACAIASYYLIETPCIRFGHALAKRINRLPVLERMGRNRLGDHREVILYSTTSPPDSFLGL